MTKSFGTFGVVLLFAFRAVAQDVDRMETFLGYTYVRFGTATNAPAFSSNGGSGQFAFNFNRWLGGVADLGAVHNGRIDNLQMDNTTMNFLFGPRLSFRYPRIRPYFQVLFGGVYFTASSQIEGTILINQSVPGVISPGESVTARSTRSQTAFAMTAGGGLDIKINKHLNFRPIGLDYYLTRIQDLRTPGDDSQHNLRYTTGLNFTFGGPR